MEIFQRNIIGGGSIISTVKEKKNAEKQGKKPFPAIGLANGLNEKQAEADAMLVHRTLQKKLMFGGLKRRNTFLKLIHNEVDIKIGEKNAVTATRDSLLMVFAK